MLNLALCIAGGILLSVIAIAIMPYVVAILISLAIFFVAVVWGIIETISDWLYQVNRKVRRRRRRL